MTLRAIISAPGSRGDVNPMIAIGSALKRIGFDVVVSLAQPYAWIAENAGLIAEPIIAKDRFDRLLSDPNVWKPIRGARTLFREVVDDFLPAHLDVIRRHHRVGQTVLISHPLDLASRIYRDADPATPLADVHLAPSILRTLDDPPRLSPWPIEIRRPRWLLRAAYWAVDTFAIDPVIAATVNRIRAEHRLPPVRRIVDQWWLSPDRILAMYPDWFAPATKSFAPRLVHCGFPLHDASMIAAIELPDDRPVIFTAGTAHRHCRDFFAAAADACVRLNQPGLLVSTHTENFPSPLPPLVRTTDYIPFGSILPVASAIVHHGGIGTTSQAMAAGLPQLVRPMAFDQFDNATRVERLNCGRWLRSDAELVDSLQLLLVDRSIRQSCERIAAMVQQGAVELAAEHISQLL